MKKLIKEIQDMLKQLKTRRDWGGAEDVVMLMEAI